MARYFLTVFALWSSMAEVYSSAFTTHALTTIPWLQPVKPAPVPFPTPVTPTIPCSTVPPLIPYVPSKPCVPVVPTPPLIPTIPSKPCVPTVPSLPLFPTFPPKPISPTLPYCSYEIIAELARFYIRSNLNFQVPTPAQRSFAAIMFTVHKLAEEMSQGASYDTAFNNAYELVQFGQLAPDYARDYVLNLLKGIEANVEPVRTWVHKNLGCINSADSQDYATCDQSVNALVRANPHYQKPAKLVVEVGKLSQLFFATKQREIEEIAVNCKEIEYVANGRKYLKALVEQIAVVFKLMR